jgi:lysophospholipase L1-like esterase
VSCYVALGDSISIDDYAGGSGCGGASLLARNRDDDFPAWHGHDLADLPFQLLATDGATSQTLLDHQLPRLERSNVRPSVVTVTIGGNDVLGWYGDTAGALRAADTAVAKTDEALDGLSHLVAPDARIVLGTVYDPSDGTADAASVGLPPCLRSSRSSATSTQRCGVWPSSMVWALRRSTTSSSATASPPAIPDRLRPGRPTGTSGTATSSSRTPGEPMPCERASGTPSSNHAALWGSRSRPDIVTCGGRRSAAARHDHGRAPTPPRPDLRLVGWLMLLGGASSS